MENEIDLKSFEKKSTQQDLVDIDGEKKQAK